MAGNVDAENAALARIYIQRGVEAGTADTVARQLMAKDALAAHALDALGFSEMTTARPIQAAFTSAATFTAGAALPLAVGAMLVNVASGLAGKYLMGPSRKRL